jgi:long-subunit fatty acid transport protein
VVGLLDPGFGDGSSELETDGLDVGFGLSTLYEFNDQTRIGLLYQSEIDPTQDGKAKFRGLGPNTEAALEKSGFLGADVEVKSTTPQSVLAGIYHEFENDHAFTVDVAWSDFSSFELSEYYFDGEVLSANEAKYKDIWALSGSYSWPASERWMLSVGGLYVHDMIEDEERDFTLRLDSIWSLGFAAEWQWTEERAIEVNFSYMTIGDAPIESPSIPALGSVIGEYSKRDIFLLRVGLKWGSL